MRRIFFDCFYLRKSTLSAFIHVPFIAFGLNCLITGQEVVYGRCQLRQVSYHVN